jgi:signal transduction histidine kinase
MSALDLPAIALAAAAVLAAVGLLRRRIAVKSAVGLLVVAALLAVLAVTPGSARTWTVLALLAAPGTLVVFPRARWHRSVDFLAITTIVSAGVLAAIAPVTVNAMSLVVLLVLAGHVWWSIHTYPQYRQALSWASICAVPAFLAFGIVGMLLPEEAGRLALLAFIPVPLGLYVGATRPHLADIRTVAVPVVSHVATATAAVAVFVGASAPIQDAMARRFSSSALVPVLGVVAAGCAAAYHPAQVVLRGLVEEILLGSRRDVLQAANFVTARISDDLVAALDALRNALALPWAAVLLDDGTAVASSGSRSGHQVTFPLGKGLGCLEVGLREDAERLGRTEQRVLALATPLLAQTLRATRLAGALRESRGQTIAAREEERRRLRRDLHDGLGPQLTGIALTADAATNLARRDPDTTAALLQDLRAETTRAIDSIRELVYGLRPPALDELGLAGAVTQATRSLRAADGAFLTVEVVAQDLPSLPAAVEVAAYRIAVEAVTNVARHAAATRATVSFATEPDRLVVKVVDDGPATTEWRPGVGLTSMRERAEELGGLLHAGPGLGGGQIVAVLPRPR